MRRIQIYDAQMVLCRFWHLPRPLAWLCRTVATWAASRGKPLPFTTGIIGFTPGPVTLVFTGVGPDDFYAHEGWHQVQARRMGLVRFWWTWLAQVARYGYVDAPLEVEARRMAGQE